MDFSRVPSVWADHLLHVWGQSEYDALQQCCATLLTEHIPCSATASHALIVVGERTGLDVPARMAMKVADACNALDAKPTVLFSGGVTDRRHFGEFPAHELADAFFSRRSDLPSLRDSVIDTESMNSATQCLLIAEMVRTERYQNVYLVLPYDHIVRFPAVLLEAFRKEFGTRGAPFVNILPVCYGSATSEAPSGFTMEREGFGPPRPALPGENASHEHILRQRAGQYGERWKGSCHQRYNPSWPCGAAFPSELLAHLQHQPYPL